MKVALELQPCLKNRSGIGTYTYELAKQLQANDTVELEGHIFNFMMCNDLMQELDGLHFLQKYCRLFSYGIYRRIWRLAPIPYRWLFGDTADITHFFNFVIPKGVKGKVVTTIHDVVWLRYPETMDEKNYKRITQNIQYSINRADCIVAVSESTKQDLIALLQVPAEKIVIASPGVDMVRFQHQYPDEQLQHVRQRYHLPKRYILYMGTLEPRKNIERLVQAFAQLQQQDDLQSYKLVLAGKKGWQYETIFTQIQQLGIEDAVICTDYVEEEDKAAIYQMADLFVFPSLYEGFGMPILEAMAAGVPVITSNVSSMPEVAGDAALLIAPDSVEQIASAMQRLLTDEALRKRCVQRGYERCKVFTWERSADILVQMYQQMMQE